MFTYQLKTIVTGKIDAMLQSGKPIGHLKSGDGIQFFLNSAITHVQTGRKRIVDFDKMEFEKMIAYNTQEIARSTDAGDKAVLTALNEVLSEIANPKKHKDKDKDKDKPEDEGQSQGSYNHQNDEPDEPKKPASKRGQPKGTVQSIVDEASLSAAEKSMWDAWKTMNAALPTQGGAIEHYARLSFQDALKLDPEQLYKSCNKLMDAIAGSGKAAELYTILHTMQDKHIDVLEQAMTLKANDNLEAQSAGKPAVSGGRGR